MVDADETMVVRRPPFGSNPVVGERGTNTQRRILAAALEVFAEVGFHDTSVELITEAAGCSRPSFYQYFSSKDDVYWAHARQLGQAMVDLADRLGTVTPDGQGVQVLRSWLDAFAGLCDEYAPVLAAVQAGVSDQLGRAVIGSVAPGQPELEIGSLPTTLVTVLVRCNFYRRTLAGAIGRQRFMDGLARTLHRLLTGPLPRANLGPVATEPAASRPGPWPAATDDGPEQGRRPRGEQTRRKLLDAGAVVLPSRGYHDTRIDDIVEEAGVSHGSFYRYFGNKDAFFRVLAEQAAGRMIELLDAFPAGSGATALRRWLDEWFATYRSNGGVISAWQEIGADPELQAFSLRAAATVFERLVRIVERRGFGDAGVDALVLLALIERVPYSVLTVGSSTEPEAIDSMVLILRRGLLGAA